MADPSFKLKLDRAREHLQAFKDEVDRWIQNEPYTIVNEPDPKPPPRDIGEYQARRLRISRVTDICPRLSVIVGDFVGNLRAALDHLALELARAYTPTISDGQVKSSEFPIYGEIPLDSKTKKQKIGCVDPAASQIIEALQPHLRGNGYVLHPLWQIHDLSRIDKHRNLLATVASSPQPTIVTCTGRSLRGIASPYPIFAPVNFWSLYWVVTSGAIVELDAVLLRWAGVPIDPNRAMSVNAHFPVQIVFDRESPLALKPVIPSLQAIYDFVDRSVIAPLSKFL